MSEAERAVALLDTNVFIHAQTNDAFTEECRRLILALETGRIRAYLDPLVLHELSYALSHYLKQWRRADVATYLKSILSWPGIEGDRALMSDTVRRWAETPGLAFVDAHLAALAARRGCAIYTKNTRDLIAQGIPVPAPLPDA